MTSFETIIIGQGMFGSAAARYLSQEVAGLAIIGPGEPADQTTHEGVFSSHYDEGRLARQFDRDPIWSALARRAIAQYAPLEATSGVKFHHPVGSLLIEPGELAVSDELALRQGSAAVNPPLTVFPAGDRTWRSLFPEFDFPETFQVIFEPGPAGYINPRKLVQAQLQSAESQGAVRISQLVTNVQETEDAVRVETASGDRFTAQRVVIAAGAFSNFHGLLPRPLPFKLKTETFILAEISHDEAPHLAGHPVVIYQIDDPEIDAIYMTPPIRYPDGHTYFKMGSNTRADQWPSSLAEVQSWFHTGDHAPCQPAMERALRAMLPRVNIQSVVSRRCIISYTPSGYPIIDWVSERILVAAGGNGRGAKGSDTVGFLVAESLLGRMWPEEFPRPAFQVSGGHPPL